MPAVTDPITITYGAYVVGGSTDRLLNGIHWIEEDFTSAAIEYEFVVTGADAASFATNVAAAEDAFRIPRGDITVSVNGSTTWSRKQSDNTGFDADPQIIKRDDEWQTGLSRLYRVRIEFGRPADNIATAGRRSSTIAVSYDANRKRTVTITGEYTALGATDARAQYAASIDAYATSVLSGLGVSNSDLVEESADNFETDKVLEFRRVYREILFSQAGASLDDPEIQEQSLVISRRRSDPGDGLEDVERLTDITVDYTATLDFTATTNLVGKWEGTIRPWITSVVGGLFAGVTALVESDPSFDFDENRISARMLYRGVPTTTLIEFERIEEMRFAPGATLVSAWVDEGEFVRAADGVTINLSKHVYRGAAVLRETVSEVYEFEGEQRGPVFSLGSALSSIRSGDFGVRFASDVRGGLSLQPSRRNIGGMKRVLVDYVNKPKVMRRGLDEVGFTTTRIDRSATWENYKPVPAADGESVDAEVEFGEREVT